MKIETEKLNLDKQVNAESKFISIIRKRSEENENSLKLLYEKKLFGTAVSILRQELDSMVRVIFISNQSVEDRKNLVSLTLSNQKWKIKNRNITDKEMVELSKSLRGWVSYVYNFGCAFIHLSSCHNYEQDDPFLTLNECDKRNISLYMKQYHFYQGGLTFEKIANYLPDVFNKIKSNLWLYLKDLEQNFLNENYKINL